MIYIRTRYDSLCETNDITGVYQVDCDDVKEQYNRFMIEKAIEINLNVNPYYLNSLDYSLHNSHLSKSEFNRKSKEWKKTRRIWNIDKFILEFLKGVKLEYKEI